MSMAARKCVLIPSLINLFWNASQVMHSARRAQRRVHIVCSPNTPPLVVYNSAVSSCNTIKSVVLRCVCYNLQISTY